MRNESLPGQVRLVCKRCRKPLDGAYLLWDERDRRVHFLGSWSAEGEGGRSVGSNEAGKFPNRRARWWDHTAGWEHTSAGWTGADPERFKFDCGGKHRNTPGFVTMDALSVEYHKAVERGDTEIALPL